MEWSKAKTILIILFLILNIFLFISIIYGSSSVGLNSEYVNNAIKYLESKNVVLEADVPSYHADSGRIVYEDSVIDENRITGFLFGHTDIPSNKTDTQETQWTEGGKTLEIGNNTIVFTDNSPSGGLNIDDKTELARGLKPWFDGLGIDQRDYIADIYNRQGDSVDIRFIRKYKGQLLFDVYAEFKVSASGVESVSVVVRNAINSIRSDVILSAYQIMVVGGIPDNSTIKEISFGYKRLKEGEINDSPAWRFRFSDGHDEFYNAYTGDRLAEPEDK